MLSAVLLLLALPVQEATIRIGGGRQQSDSIRRVQRRDSIRLEVIERAQDRERRPPVRIPVTPEHERTAFKSPDARTLLLRAREARLRQDSSLLSYDATARQRVSAGIGFRAIGKDRLLFRTENVSRVRWSKANGVLIDMKGRRTAVPMANREARREIDVEMNDISPIPYYPGREALWIGAGMARAEVDEREMVHPIATGAEAYYRYEAGDSVTITLPDGAAIRLRELRIEPRRPEWKFSVGSFWFDQVTGQLVRAVYRFAAPMNIWAVADEELAREREEDLKAGRQPDPDDEVPGWVKGMMSPMEANLEAVTIEYGLYGGRYWLPRAQYAEGHAKAGFMRVPFKLEESFKYAEVNGRDSVPPLPARPTLRSIRDSLFGADAARWRDLSPDERSARLKRIMEADSVLRAARRSDRERECAVSGSYTRVEDRIDRELRTHVRIPCDTAALANSPEFQRSIYDEGEELFGVAERAELLKALDFSLQPGWMPMPIRVEWGLPLTRYNRVEGFSTGLRATQQLGLGYSLDGAARFGTGDRTGYAELGASRSNGRYSYRVGAYRRLAAANNDWGNPLSLGASLSALMSGRDEGFYYRSGGVELTRTLDRGGGLALRTFAERHTTAPLSARFNLRRALGASVEFGPNIAVSDASYAGGSLRHQGSLGDDPLGWRFYSDLRLEGAARLDDPAPDSAQRRYVRTSGDVTVTRGFGPGFAAAVTLGAGYSQGTPVQRQFFFGGAHTVRGQVAGARVGESYWLGRLELSRAVGIARPVVFGDLGWAGPWEQRRHPGRPMSGVGIGSSILDGLIRLDLSHGLYPRKGKRFDLYLEARF